MRQGFSQPIVLLLVILAIGLSAGLIWYKTMDKATTGLPNSNGSTGTAVATTSPKNTPPAGWQAYESKKYGFKMQYPPDWSMNPLNKAALYSSLSLYNYDTLEIEKYMDHGIVDMKKFGKPMLKIEVSPQTISYPITLPLPDSDELLQVNNEQEYVAAEVRRSMSAPLADTSSPLRIGGSSTYQLKFADDPNSVFEHTRVYFAFPKGRVVTVLVVYKSVNGEKFEETEHRDTVDKVLQSISFTDLP